MVVAVLVVAVGCGTRKTQTRETAEPTKPATAEPEPPLMERQVHLAWSTEPDSSPGAEPPKQKVYLAVTDERGRTNSYPLGSLAGTCSELGADQTFRTATAFQCSWHGTGVQLQAVVGTGELLVMSMNVTEGAEPDPMARTQIARVEIPVGAKITVGGN